MRQVIQSSSDVLNILEKERVFSQCDYHRQPNQYTIQRDAISCEYVSQDGKWGS